MDIFSRSFIYMLVGGVLAGFALQTEWAVDHDFEYYEARVFSTALAIFIVIQAIRIVLRRTVLDISEKFDDKYAEFVLLLAFVPVFAIISNDFVRIVVIVFYIVVLLKFSADTLEIEWCARLVDGLTENVERLYDTALGRTLRFVVVNDFADDVLNISVRTNPRAQPSVSELKARTASLYQDLPDTKQFEKIRVDIRRVAEIDETLSILLAPISHYARLVGASDVAIAGTSRQIEKASAILPAKTYSFELSESGGEA